MISRIAAHLTAVLLKEQIIAPDDREICQYGFEITIANMVNGMIVFLVGISFHRIAEAVIFYLAFVSLRFFCGGYHADSYASCFLLFLLTNAVCLAVSGWIVGYTDLIFLMFIVAAALLWLCIFQMAPLEHENRSLTCKERLYFRKRSMQVYCFWMIVGIVLWAVHLTQMMAVLISTFITVTILMIGGKHHEKRNTETACKNGKECSKAG